MCHLLLLCLQFQRLTSSSFRTLYARLPRGARDIYYRDQIGNISSSEIAYVKHIMFGSVNVAV